ncbi:MAG: hypothetical protein JWP87_1571 [Labilithrix sp.]|jgi:transcriptional regulator with GAF, ATPase, and Fis domain|nr:hypothetical protein [Labilithrix sp.]
MSALRTMILLDALDATLHADLEADALLAAAARILARELECLCMAELFVEGGARVVALAHTDRALSERLRAAVRPDVVAPAARARAIVDRRRPAVVELLEAGDAERHGLAEVSSWTGRRAYGFIAAPLVVRGSACGVLWIIAVRRGRRPVDADAESIARVASVLALAWGAAFAHEHPRETTGTRRSYIASR